MGKEPRENFLPEHLLIWAAHKDKWRFWSDLDNIQPSTFNLQRNGEKGKSVDWEKHCYCPGISLSYKKKPTREVNGIMQISVLEIDDNRELISQNLDLEHIPLRTPPKGRKPNRSHSEILNYPPKNQKIRHESEIVHIRALLVDCPSCEWGLKPINTQNE